MTRRKAIKDFAYIATVGLFLPRAWAQDVLPVRRRIPVAAAGGAINAFAKVQTSVAITEAVTLTTSTLTFGSNITAESLLLVWCKWEDTSTTISSVVETTGGGAFTARTMRDQETGTLHGQLWYRLSATGGGTNITINRSISSFASSIAMEFSSGGTKSYVAEGLNGADSGTSMTSGAVSNSGTQRLNLAGYGGYSGDAITARQINSVTGTDEPAAQVSDTWVWWTTGNLSSNTATGTRAASEGWILNLSSFAAD